MELNFSQYNEAVKRFGKEATDQAIKIRKDQDSIQAAAQEQSAPKQPIAPTQSEISGMQQSVTSIPSPSYPITEGVAAAPGNFETNVRQPIQVQPLPADYIPQNSINADSAVTEIPKFLGRSAYSAAGSLVRAAQGGLTFARDPSIVTPANDTPIIGTLKKAADSMKWMQSGEGSPLSVTEAQTNRNPIFSTVGQVGESLADFGGKLAVSGGVMPAMAGLSGASHFADSRDKALSKGASDQEATQMAIPGSAVDAATFVAMPAVTGPIKAAIAKGISKIPIIGALSKAANVVTSQIATDTAYMTGQGVAISLTDKAEGINPEYNPAEALSGKNLATTAGQAALFAMAHAIQQPRTPKVDPNLYSQPATPSDYDSMFESYKAAKGEHPTEGQAKNDLYDEMVRGVRQAAGNTPASRGQVHDAIESLRKAAADRVISDKESDQPRTPTQEKLAKITGNETDADAVERLAQEQVKTDAATVKESKTVQPEPLTPKVNETVSPEVTAQAKDIQTFVDNIGETTDPALKEVVDKAKERLKALTPSPAPSSPTVSAAAVADSATPAVDTEVQKSIDRIKAVIAAKKGIPVADIPEEPVSNAKIELPDYNELLRKKANLEQSMFRPNGEVKPTASVKMLENYVKVATAVQQIDNNKGGANGSLPTVPKETVQPEEVPSVRDTTKIKTDGFGKSVIDRPGDAVTLYHGSNSDDHESILANGIAPNKKYGLGLAEQEQSRLLADSSASRTTAKDRVIYKIEIPKSEITRIEKDHASSDAHDWRMYNADVKGGNIKPEWIKAVKIGNTGEWQDIILKGGDTNGQVQGTKTEEIAPKAVAQDDTGVPPTAKTIDQESHERAINSLMEQPTASIIYHPKIKKYAVKAKDNLAPGSDEGYVLTPAQVKKMESAGILELSGVNSYSLTAEYRQSREEKGATEPVLPEGIYKTKVKSHDGTISDMYGVRKQEQDAKGSNFGDTLHATVEEAAAAQKRQIASHEANKERLAKIAEKEAADKVVSDAAQAARSDIDGFADDKPVLQRTNIQKILDKTYNYQGKPIKSKDLIKKQIADGAVIETENVPDTTERNKLGAYVKANRGRVPFGNQYHPETIAYNKAAEALKGEGPQKVETRLVKPDGSFTKFNKTELDYAQHLINKASIPALKATDKVVTPEKVTEEPVAKESEPAIIEKPKAGVTDANNARTTESPGRVSREEPEKLLSDASSHAQGIYRSVRPFEKAGYADPGQTELKGEQKTAYDAAKAQEVEALTQYMEQVGAFPSDGFVSAWEQQGKKGETEHKVALSPDGKTLRKFGTAAINHTWTDYLKRIELHNSIFGGEAYTFKGFSTIDGILHSVIDQNYFHGEHIVQADSKAVDSEMKRLGFEPYVRPQYAGKAIEVTTMARLWVRRSDMVAVWDVRPANVLYDTTLDALHFIDPVIEQLPKDYDLKKLIPLQIGEDGSVIGSQFESKNGEVTPIQTAEEIVGPTENSLKISPNDVPYDVAVEAFKGVSMNPERRARDEQQGYVNAVTSLYEEVLPSAVLPEQKTALDSAIQIYREKYLDHVVRMLRAKSGTVSSMIAGRSNFKPTTRANNAEDRATQAFLEWLPSGKRAVENAVEFAKPVDQRQAEAIEAEWKKIRTKIIGDIAVVKGIDEKNPDWAGFERGAFTTSLNNLFKKLSNDGNTEMLKRSFEVLDKANAALNKPVFTDRHSIWSLRSGVEETVPPVEPTVTEEPKPEAPATLSNDEWLEANRGKVSESLKVKLSNGDVLSAPHALEMLDKRLDKYKKLLDCLNGGK